MIAFARPTNPEPLQCDVHLEGPPCCGCWVDTEPTEIEVQITGVRTTCPEEDAFLAALAMNVTSKLFPKELGNPKKIAITIHPPA